MGNSTQRKKAHASFLHAYDIIQQDEDVHIKFLQHKTTHEEYLLKQLTFNNIKQCHKAMDKLSQLKAKLNGNKNVVELKEFVMNSDEQYCGTFYKVYALFEYPMRTLDDQIGERKLQKKSFSEAELWSILASCVSGLSHLQKNGIKHETLKSRNIILSHQGIIKISDPYTLGLPTNYQSMLTKLNNRHIYPSPEQIQCLQQQLISPTYNTYKNDVFGLGMIMLQAALLEYQDDQCYTNDRLRIRWDGVQYNVDRVGKCYSEQIKNMLGFMLVKDENMRPDWIFLQQNCMESGGKKSAVSMNSNKSRSIATSQKFSINNSNFGKHIPFRSTSQINSLENFQNINQQNFIKIDTSRALIEEPVTQTQPIFQQSSYNLPRANYTFGTPNAVTQPQIVISPVRVVSRFHGTPEILPSTHNLQNNHHIFSSKSIVQMPLPSRQSIPIQHQQQHSQQVIHEPGPNISIASVKPSIIEETRPLRNIFPADQYMCRTKIDDNIIRSQCHDKAMITQKSNISYGTAVPELKNFSSPITTQYRTILRSQPEMTSFSTPTNNQLQKAKDNTQLFRVFANNPNEDHISAEIHQKQLEYVVENYEQGSRYQGQKLNGLRHGMGKFYYQDGGMYDGEWKQDRMHGYGKLYYQSDKLAYEGQWINDQFSGKGVIYNEEPEPLHREFNYRNFDDLEEYWAKYEGQFINDSKYGRGLLHLSNGQVFDGYFKADYIQGPGTFYTKDGSSITGTWSQNRKIA